MACLKPSELWAESDKVYAKWMSSRAIEKWGFTNDQGVFKKLFETATGKPLMAGIDLQPKDMRKMNVAIDKLEKDLKNPGVLSNKIINNIYVGSAISMRNPITKDFFEVLTNANEFRNSNSSAMTGAYNRLVGSLKHAIMEFEGVEGLAGRRTANKRFEELNDKEKAITLKIKNGESVGTANEWGILRKFLDNEGSVFEDFIMRVEEGSSEGLHYKYRDQLVEKKPYLNLINKAASEWSEVQIKSKKNLIRSINNLSEIITHKYGEKSRTAEFLVNEYKEIASKLEDSPGNYIPHYVLDILGQSIEIGSRMSKSKTNTERDNIISEYVAATKDINTNLLQRLKERGDQPSEYFTRNPMLYAQKYIEQVIQFNHNSHVDLAYIKGLKKLTETAFKNEGTKEGEAAKVYQGIFNDLYNSTMNKDNRIDIGSDASNITRLLTSIQFTSKLGFSTRGALRNSMQRLLNFMYFGTRMQLSTHEAFKDKNYLEAMEGELHYHGLQFTDISKVTEGAVTASDLIAHGIDYEKGILTFKDKETILSKATKAASWTADKSAYLTKWAENVNRKSTFKVAFHKRVEQLKQSDRYSNFFEDSAIRKEMYRSAGNYASKIVSLLHFEYAPHGKSKVFRTKTGAVLGQFQHYALSFANLQTQLVKDYGKALKAGDYTGEELGRIIRMMSIYAMAELVSGYMDMDFTTYVNNDTLDRAGNLVKLLTGDEDEKMKAFHSKGAVGAVGLVPISDLVEIHNLGAAAGYWNLLADEKSTAGWLMGMRKYKSIDNDEFIKEAAGMLSIELDRLVNNTWPARKYSNPLGSMLRAELGLYPGTTSMGIDTRAMRKKFVPKKAKKGKALKPYEILQKKFEKASDKKMSKKLRNSAIESLSNFGD